MKPHVSIIAALFLVLGLAACSEASETPLKDKPSASAHPPIAASRAAPTKAPAVASPKVDTYLEVYRKIDLSFSDIAIGTPYWSVATRLTIIRVNGRDCEAELECWYRDTANVSHAFGSDGSRPLLMKSVSANEFADRPISALGIGLARDKPNVMAKVRAFAPEIAFVCGGKRDLGINECGGGEFDAWVEVKFDSRDRLHSVAFDTYPI